MKIYGIYLLLLCACVAHGQMRSPLLAGMRIMGDLRDGMQRTWNGFIDRIRGRSVPPLPPPPPSGREFEPPKEMVPPPLPGSTTPRTSFAVFHQNQRPVETLSADGSFIPSSFFTEDAAQNEIDNTGLVTREVAEEEISDFITNENSNIFRSPLRDELHPPLSLQELAPDSPALGDSSEWTGFTSSRVKHNDYSSFHLPTRDERPVQIFKDSPSKSLPQANQPAVLYPATTFFLPNLEAANDNKRREALLKLASLTTSNEHIFATTPIYSTTNDRQVHDFNKEKTKILSHHPSFNSIQTQFPSAKPITFTVPSPPLSSPPISSVLSSSSSHSSSAIGYSQSNSGVIPPPLSHQSRHIPNRPSPIRLTEDTTGHPLNNASFSNFVSSSPDKQKRHPKATFVRPSRGLLKRASHSSSRNVPTKGRPGTFIRPKTVSIPASSNDLLKPTRVTISPRDYQNNKLTSPEYQFGYGVEDSNSGTRFSHSERHLGGLTEGSYQVKLPDGRTQIVEYQADEKGFRPRIRFEGKALFPKLVPKS